MRSLFLLLILGLFAPFSLSATTIVPFEHMSQLVQASDAVVAVRAMAPYETAAASCTHFDCDFTVISSLKGPFVTDSTFSLRQYSYRDDFGALTITGDFIPVQDKVYLIFLDEFEGVWRPMMLSYYIFEESLVANEYFWYPVESSLSIGVMPLPNGQEAEPLAVYKRDELLQLIQQSANEPTHPWDPTSALTTLPTHVSATDRALPTGCDFNLGTIGLSRWLNTTINIYYDITGAPADAALRVTSTLAYLVSNYPGLNLIPAGPTNFTPDCSDGQVSGQDFINYLNSSLSGQQSILVMFEDPCNQIPNLSGCSGTLGVGGSYALSTTHVYKGDTWKNSAWGYMVVNNGVRACQTETNFDRFLSHELTHAFKMDHLDPTLYPGNNMNPSCCNPINAKDRECMNYVYESALPPLPVELTSFTATAQKDRILVQWATALEVNNDRYVIEKSPDGLHFETLATVDAARASNQPNRYEVADMLPFHGDNYYRLVQIDLDGATSNFGVVTARFDAKSDGYLLLPNPVHDGQLQLIARSGELEFESIELIDLAGRQTVLHNTMSDASGGRLDISLASLPKGVYWLKVNAGGTSEVLKFVKM